MEKNTTPKLSSDGEYWRNESIRLQAEVESLKAENAELDRKLIIVNDAYRVSYRDAGVVAEELQQCQSLNAELVEALKGFFNGTPSVDAKQFANKIIEKHEQI